jgi:transposase-like protein
VIAATERFSVRDVAREFGVSMFAIWQWRNAAGRPKRRPGPKA